MNGGLAISLMTAFVLGGIALALDIRAYHALQRAALARRWPIAIGVVIASGVRETTILIRHKTAQYRPAVRYAPQVIYEYHVGGQHYQHDRINVDGVVLSSEPADAARAARRYPVGRQVAVAYNPANPNEACLRPTVTWVVWIEIALSVGLWLAAGWFIITGMG